MIRKDKCMIARPDPRYPDPKILRNEVNSMCDSLMEILLESIPEDAIAGIYFKGSGHKEWESPLDYVPEISDVDIHLLFSDDQSVERYLGTTEQAIEIQKKLEKRYLEKVAEPYHFPRPQLMVLNLLLQEKDFVSSPKNTISVLFGGEYPVSDCSNHERIMRIDCNHLLEEEEFILRFPLHIIDKPSKYLWQSLRNLVWHISPIGARVLSIMGMAYEKAWSMNRTRIIAHLKEVGEQKLAQDYTQFYLDCWKYFLSRYRDTDVGRSAIIAGIKALLRGVERAKLGVKSCNHTF